MDKFIQLEVDRVVEDKALLNGEVSKNLQDKLIGSLKDNAQGMQEAPSNHALGRLLTNSVGIYGSHCRSRVFLILRR